MILQRNERIGELAAFGHAALYGTLPLFIVMSKDVVPPLFFIGASFLCAGLFMAPLAYYSEADRLRLNPQAALPFAVGLVIIMLIIYPIVTIAGQNTSAGNIAILNQTEVFFSFLLFGLLGTELVTKARLIGAGFIVAGATAVLLQSASGTLAVWDILIVFAVSLAPFANHFQKAALQHIGPMTLVTWRNLISGTLLICAGIVFENIALAQLSIEQLLLIALNGLFAFGIAKWLLFIGFHRIGVAKTIAINGTAPAVTMLLAFFILAETPSVAQIFGLLLIAIGVYLITMRQTSTFTGRVTTGDRIGTELGFPTLNLVTVSKIASGVYVARARIGEREYPAVLHAGQRPTIGKKDFRLELHLLDTFTDVAPAEVTVEIVRHLRAVKNFRDTNRLQAQIAKDVAAAKVVLEL